MHTVAVIDYGMGNLRSVANALEHVGEHVGEQVAGDTRVIVTGDPKAVLAAERVVFPGVGAIRDCMAELQARGLIEAIRECTQTKPFLGICLGMQALLDFSEENNGVPCLGILPGTVREFSRGLKDPNTGDALKIPHMGWNRVHQTVAHSLWRDIPQDSYFYFVHGFYAELASPEIVAGSTSYGLPFASACARDNVFAVQFHPEKSQQAGLQLLANFLRWEHA
jgi:glutamine amidotransferase